MKKGYKPEPWIDAQHKPGKIKSHAGQGRKVPATKRTGKEVGGGSSHSGPYSK